MAIPKNHSYECESLIHEWIGGGLVDCFCLNVLICHPDYVWWITNLSIQNYEVIADLIPPILTGLRATSISYHTACLGTKITFVLLTPSQFLSMPAQERAIDVWDTPCRPERNDSCLLCYGIHLNSMLSINPRLVTKWTVIASLSISLRHLNKRYSRTEESWTHSGWPSTYISAQCARARQLKSTSLNIIW
jgi:hypothetical protein